MEISARIGRVPNVLPLGFIMIAVVAFMGGCGDDLGGGNYGGGGFGDNLPAQGSGALQCRNLTESVCEMWVECGELASSEYVECTEILDAELDCDLARGTSSGYQSCVADLETGCYALDAGLPSSCSGVILF